MTATDINRWAVDLDATAWQETGAQECWEKWDIYGPRPHIWAEFLDICPELAGFRPQVEALEVEYAHRIRTDGARMGVKRWLAASRNVDDFLDRRALVVFAASAAGCNTVPVLPVLQGLLGIRRGTHGRLLRPLEVAAARAVAYFPPRVALLHLLSAGASLTEATVARAEDVDRSADGQVSVAVGSGRARRRLTLAPGAAAADVVAVAEDSPDGFLLPGGNAPDMESRRHYVSEMVRRIFVMMGLGDDPTATANSVRFTGLRAVADRFGIQAASYCAGARSYERLQQQLRLAPNTGH